MSYKNIEHERNLKAAKEDAEKCMNWSQVSTWRLYCMMGKFGRGRFGNVSGGSRNIERGFPLVVDPRCGGLGAQPPAAEDVLVFISIRSN